MFIQTESTPNPATLKFLPGRAVLDLGTADFPRVDTACNARLATGMLRPDRKGRDRMPSPTGCASANVKATSVEVKSISWP